MIEQRADLLRRVIIVGGAGFIGSHFTDRLLERENTESVTIFDNFSSGREWHIDHHAHDDRFHLIKGDVSDLSALSEAMSGHDTVIHLASNPDIARAMTEPAVDFYQGTLLTHHVVEAMRLTGARQILYASGSGIYGDLGEREGTEDYGPLIPVSTYGASKLAGEALISSYCYMFEIDGLCVSIRERCRISTDSRSRVRLRSPVGSRFIATGNPWRRTAV